VVSLRLFASPQDAADDRRQAARQRASRQLRCGACGRFARAERMQFGHVCDHCIYDDKRRAIRDKVEQARRWWVLTGHSSDRPAAG